MRVDGHNKTRGAAKLAGTKRAEAEWQLDGRPSAGKRHKAHAKARSSGKPQKDFVAVIPHATKRWKEELRRVLRSKYDPATWLLLEAALAKRRAAITLPWAQSAETVLVPKVAASGFLATCAICGQELTPYDAIRTHFDPECGGGHEGLSAEYFRAPKSAPTDPFSATSAASTSMRDKVGHVLAKLASHTHNIDLFAPSLAARKSRASSTPSRPPHGARRTCARCGANASRACVTNSACAAEEGRFFSLLTLRRCPSAAARTR